MNRALGLWAKRVLVPQIYTFSVTCGTHDYNLPSYIRNPSAVWVQSSYSNPDTIAEWNEYGSFSIVPNGTGGFTLRLNVTPNNGNAAIIWYAENSPFPTGSVTVTTTINSTATSVDTTVSGSPHVGNTGWLKIGDEWIFYGSLTRTSSTSYTAGNLLRAQYGSVAASHTSTTAISWGIAVDDERLWQQLYDRVGSFIHFLNLHKSTNEDTSRHEKLYGEMKMLADGFWQREGYLSARKPRLTLNRAALGATAFAWN